VKPGNIMLDQDGWVVMTDFGIAKVAQAEALTMTGGMVGTPAYMSPEQCQGIEVTGAADQYSLGIVAYEMLTGKPPFASPTMVNVIYDHCHTPPPPLQALRADVPAELAAAVLRMIAKDPAERFSTIEDAVTAVGLAQESHDVVRTRILTLVKSRATAKLLDKFRTPTSPVPHPRTMSPAPPSPATPATGPDTPGTPAPQVLTTPSGTGSRARVPAMVWAIPVTVVAVAGVVILSRRPPEVPPPAGLLSPPAPVPVAVTRMDVSPLSLAITVGAEARLTAVLRDSAGASVPAAVLWEALDPQVAVVSADGLVRGVTAGQGRVVARSGGASASAVVTVSPAAVPPAPTATRTVEGPARVASVGVSPPGLSLAVGESARLTAALRAADGAALSGRPIAWTSSDSRVARVNPDGSVTAAAPGTALVTASVESASATVAVTVSTAPVAAIAVEPPQLALTVGAQERLVALARDGRGTALTDRPVQWRSSNPGVAAVDGSGLVTAVGPGAATVSASADGVSGSAAIAVAGRAAATPPPAPDARAAIAQIIEEYRRAIEARDVEGLRRLYPGMTPQQEQAWRGFFSSVSALSARLDITSLELTGDSARAAVSAVYEFRADRRETQNSAFAMRLRRAGDGWRIVSVQ
jgi:serine/threonine-protein kinase